MRVASLRKRCIFITIVSSLQSTGFPLKFLWILVDFGSIVRANLIVSVGALYTHPNKWLNSETQPTLYVLDFYEQKQSSLATSASRLQ